MSNTISWHGTFGGAVGFHRHAAVETGCAMRFAVFLPPQATSGKVPVLYYLAGLTCTEETLLTSSNSAYEISRAALKTTGRSRLTAWRSADTVSLILGLSRSAEICVGTQSLHLTGVPFSVP